MKQRTHSYAVLGLTLIVLSACATGAPLSPAAQASPPASWSNRAEGMSSGSQDLSRWWEQLGDTVLNDLVTSALAGSPDLHTAQARLRQSRAQRRIASADLTPSVSGSASVSDRHNAPLGISAGFDANWEPDAFGGTRKGVDAATAAVRATAADLNSTQVSLVAEVARNYVELRTFQTREDIARRNETAQAQTLELTQFRAQAGLVSSVDVEQARSNLEQTRAQIPSLGANITQTIHRLSVLAGLEPSALSAQLHTPAPVPEVPTQITVGIPAETLRQRPDVRAAEARVLAETARLDQAKTRRYPQFSLSGSIGADVLTGALSGGTSLVRSVAGSVLQTIFDGGRIRQQIQVQSAVQEQAVAAYDSTVLIALEDVENALVSVESTRQRLASLERAGQAAANAALLANMRYQSGLTDFQTVLDTQRTVLSVQDSVATTAGERATALVQLYKALGGGWSSAPAAIAGTRPTKS